MLRSVEATFKSFFFANEMFHNFTVTETSDNGPYKENHIRLCNEGPLLYGRTPPLSGVSMGYRMVIEPWYWLIDIVE